MTVSNDQSLQSLKEAISVLTVKLDERFNLIDEKFKRLDEKIDERFNLVDEKFKRVDEKFKGVEDKLGGLDKRLEKVENSRRLFLRFEIGEKAGDQKAQIWTLIGVVATALLGVTGGLVTVLIRYSFSNIA